MRVEVEAQATVRVVKVRWGAVVLRAENGEETTLRAGQDYVIKISNQGWANDEGRVGHASAS